MAFSWMRVLISCSRSVLMALTLVASTSLLTASIEPIPSPSPVILGVVPPGTDGPGDGHDVDAAVVAVGLPAWACAPGRAEQCPPNHIAAGGGARQRGGRGWGGWARRGGCRGGRSAALRGWWRCRGRGGSSGSRPRRRRRRGCR